MLNEFFDVVKHIQKKNQGGCLFFCYLFYKWLEKNNMDKSSFSIIQYEYKGDDYIEQNERFLSNEADEPVSSSHFTWMYEGVEYDACGPYNKNNWPNRIGKELLGLSSRYGHLVDEFCEQALNKGDWNSSFDRNEAIEYIEENMNISMWDVQEEK